MFEATASAYNRLVSSALKIAETTRFCTDLRISSRLADIDNSLRFPRTSQNEDKCEYVRLTNTWCQLQILCMNLERCSGYVSTGPDSTWGESSRSISSMLTWLLIIETHSCCPEQPKALFCYILCNDWLAYQQMPLVHLQFSRLNSSNTSAHHDP